MWVSRRGRIGFSWRGDNLGLFLCGFLVVCALKMGVIKFLYDIV